MPLWLLLLASSVFAGAPIEADVAVVYAPSYASSVGGDDNAQVNLANMVAGNNLIQNQGGTGARMRVAGYFKPSADLINATSTGGMVNWLANNDSHVQDALAFGSSAGADLLVYICQYNDSASIAGVSEQPGMYSALNPGAVFYPVFAHETGGHAYGRSHSDGVPNPKTIMLHNYCTGGGGAAPPYFYSNPHIWYNGVQLVGDANNNCSMGSLVNGGDNSAPSAQSVADRRARIIVGPDLTNTVLHWSFTNAPGAAPAGTSINDLITSAPAVVRGNGAVFTGTALRIPGGTTGNAPMSSMAAYLDLPNGLVSSQINITIEIWAAPLSAPSFARIFEFGRTVQPGDGLGAPGEYTGNPANPAPGATQSLDDIMLSAAVGTSISQQRFEAKLSGVVTNHDAGLATVAGVPHHYAVTFTDGAGIYGSSGGRWQWYRDGDSVTFLDVNYHLVSLQDVNNWLGRSQWSADSMANNDYAEVRISDVAMSRGQILANYLLGPNYVQSTTATLTGSDTSGTSSFNAAGKWSTGAAPAPGNTYETFDFLLFTPATGSAYNFAGDSLRVSGGSLLWKGTASSTLTVNDLILNGGTVSQAGGNTMTLAGNITVTTNGGVISDVSGPANITAAINGNGPLTFLGNTATLGGNNSGYTGRLFIGNGMAGAVSINSQSRLGASPTNFISDQLVLNRGSLLTTATMALDATNRGILFDVSGGTFNVASGTTLTVSSALSVPSNAPSIVVGSLTKANSGALILNSPSNTFKGTLFVDTASTTANDGVVRVAHNQVMANAHSPIFIRNNNSGSSTLQLDGANGNITLPQGMAVSCRNNSTATVQNLSGTNTISGTIYLNVGGNMFNIQSDAGLLVFKGTNQYTGSLTGGRTYAFSGAGGILVSGPILNSTNGAPISLSKSGTGTLTLAGTNTYGGATAFGGGTVFVTGVLPTNSVMVSAGTLSGVGKILGAVSVQSGATFAPGTNVNVIGKLIISNQLTLAPGSATRIKISKNGPTLTNDLVTGIISLSCNGALTVTNVGSGTLAAGDSFKIFSAGSFGGGFSSVNLPPLGSYLYWTNRLAVDGTLAVVSSVSTVSTNVGFNFDGTNMNLFWPADHIGWRLLVQTGQLSAGISLDTNDWMTVPGSQQTNQLIIPFDLTLPVIFYRLVYP